MQTRTRLAAILAVGALAALPAASQAAPIAAPGDVPQMVTMTPQGGSLPRINGHAWNTGPGGATRAECVGYADAFNELAAQSENALLAGDNKKSDEKGKLATGILKAGQARGCTFLPDAV